MSSHTHTHRLRVHQGRGGGRGGGRRVKGARMIQQARSCDDLSSHTNQNTSPEAMPRSVSASALRGGARAEKSNSVPTLKVEEIKRQPLRTLVEKNGSAIENQESAPGVITRAVARRKEEEGEGEREDSPIELMHKEFSNRRKLILSELPLDWSEEKLSEYLRSYSCKLVSKIRDGGVRLLFPSMHQAKVALALLNSAHLGGHKLTASFGHPDSLLFVGNLPLSYTSQDLSSLFGPYGETLRCFIVSSLLTRASKGYGFVEFATREEALFAKQQMATKVVGQRSLRVDFADNGMQTFQDLHSKTLFVDRLPKGFTDDVALREVFSKYGTVNFCQVALMPTGSSRGFAFVDMSSVEGAELAQARCNGVQFVGAEIRVAFGMPCRPGACILQHKPHPHPPTHRHPVFHKPPASLCKETLSFIPLKSCAPSTILLKPHPPVPFPLPHSHTVSEPLFPSLRPSHPHSVTSHSPPPVSKNDPLARIKQTTSPLGRKRQTREWDRDELVAVYDQAYIGQHQQGIPYTHPLKRIRMEDSN